jgi:hypothetical protein
MLVCLFTCTGIASDKFHRAVKALAGPAPAPAISGASRVYENETCELSLFAYIFEQQAKKHGWPVTQSADAFGGDLTWVAVDASLCFAWL